MVEDSAQNVAKAFNSLPGVEVVQTNFKSDQIGYLLRIREEDNALKIAHHLLSKEDGWQSHICKKYFMADGSMKYSWSFTFRASKIDVASERIRRVITLYRDQYMTSLPADSGDEVAFLAPATRGVYKNGKGATPLKAGGGVRR